MTPPLEYRLAEHTAGPTEDELAALDESETARLLVYWDSVVIESAPDVPGMSHDIEDWLWWWDYRERTDVPLW